MLQATNNANAAAPVHPNNAEHNPAQSAGPSQQALLNGLAAWRRQGNLPRLVAEHRDVASRLIEQFVNDPHSRTLDLRGLQLQGLPKEITDLKAVLTLRGTAAAPAEIRLSSQAFATTDQRKACVRCFAGHLQITQSHLSDAAASSSAGPSAPSGPLSDPNHYRQSAGCVAAVAGAMQQETLPLFADLVKNLQTLAQCDNSTLRTARDFFIALRTKVNSNIGKTTAHQHEVSLLPELDCRYPMPGREKMRYVQEDLLKVSQALQDAKASRFCSSSNVTKASLRVGQLQMVAQFIDQMFESLPTVQRQVTKLKPQVLELEKSLTKLNMDCIRAEVQSEIAEHVVLELSDQLTQQIKTLRQACEDINSLRNQLDELVWVEIPEKLRGSLPLLQLLQSWDKIKQPQFESLQQYNNIGWLLAQLVNLTSSVSPSTQLITGLAGQLGKLTENSHYWTLIQTHPLPVIRQLAESKPQIAPAAETLNAVKVISPEEVATASIKEVLPSPTPAVRSSGTSVDVPQVVKTATTTATVAETAFEAAARGDWEAIQQCLRVGFSPVETNDQQQTLLHVAAQHGHTKLITSLLDLSEKELLLSARCTLGYTPFLQAASAGQAVAMETLVSLGADPHVRDLEGRKAIHLAARFGNEAALKYCVRSIRQNMDEACRGGLTPHLHAACGGNLSTMKWLERQGASPSSTCQLTSPDIHSLNSVELRLAGDMAIHLAARFGHLDVVKHCVSGSRQRLAYERGNNGKTPLLAAAAGGNVEVMRWLVFEYPRVAHSELFEPPMRYILLHLPTALRLSKIHLEHCKNICDSEGNKALHYAVEAGSLDTVRFCCRELGHGVNERMRYGGGLLLGRSPLLIAIQSGNLDMVRWLIKHGADRNVAIYGSGDEKRGGALNVAVENDNLEMVQYCVQDLKVDLEMKGSLYGNTPFLEAVQRGRLDIARWLKDHGAACDAKNSFGSTAMHIAAESGGCDILEYLLDELDMGLELKDNVGRTPLLVAAQAGNLDMVRWLIKHGADYNVARYRSGDDKRGGVLNVAVENDNLEMVQYCVQDLKVDLEMKGAIGGNTPFLEAVERGRLDIARWLKDNGAACNAKNSFGRTALFIAAQSGRCDILEYLLDELDMGLELKDNLGKTPLLVAAQAGKLEAVDWLFKQGANIHAVDQDGCGLVDLAKDNVKAYARSLF